MPTLASTGAGVDRRWQPAMTVNRSSADTGVNRHRHWPAMVTGDDRQPVKCRHGRQPVPALTGDGQKPTLASTGAGVDRQW